MRKGAFSGVSPLGALAAIVILGITIEVVEQQNKSAAYVLVVVILLGAITFNAGVFRAQTVAIVGALNAPSRMGHGGGGSFK